MAGPVTSRPPADLARDSMQQVGSDLEADLLATSDAEAVGAALASVCAPLGEVREGLFDEAGVGLVAGLRLADDRRVVVKVHRHHATTARLTACLEVQRHLHDAGLPTPRPLLPVTPLGSGLATVEELVAGEAADGRRPTVRRSLAIEDAMAVEGFERRSRAISSTEREVLDAANLTIIAYGPLPALRPGAAPGGGRQLRRSAGSGSSASVPITA